MILPSPSPCDAAETKLTFWEKAGQLFEHREFLFGPKTSVKRREPGGPVGQGAGCAFFASFLYANKEMKVPQGGATP